MILDAQPDAQFVYGIREGVSRDMLAHACEEGGEAVRACLNMVNVKAGDVYYIPAGMVHALGGGVTLMEIQQSSDVTYRFYDWDRVDAQGKGRELHIQKGLDVTDVSLHLPPCAGTARAFVVARWHCESEMELPLTPEHFVLLCALGDGKLTWEGGEMILRRGDCVFLPAECERTNLCGQVDALLTWVE